MIDRLVQVIPIRVIILDQLKFPCAFPFLGLTFSRERRFPRFVRLIPDQLVYAVVRRESLDDLFFVLPDALGEIVRRAGVERAVPFAREDVNEKGFHGPLEFNLGRNYQPAHSGESRNPVKK